ncbi:MAG: hypothetical protein ABUL77_03265 [Bacteroidota bacterium]
MKMPLSIACYPLAVAAGLFVGCEVHDNVINIPNATVNATTSADVDVDNVMPAQVIPIALNVQNVYLVDPATTPPPEHVADAGHVQIYLDDVETPPILVTAEANVMVTIPPATKPGKHKLICRVHKHDKTPTSTKVEVEINVKVTVSTGGTGGAGAGTGGAGTGTGGAATGAGGSVGTGGSSAGGAGGA